MNRDTLSASLLKKRIFIWKPFTAEHNTDVRDSIVCSTYSCYKRSNDYWRFVNPESFGNRLLNPYHIFQVRFQKNIEPKMLISTETDWFKIRDVTPYNEGAKFINLISIHIPSDKFMLELAQKVYGSSV
jgi:hypothetical protein